MTFWQSCYLKMAMEPLPLDQQKRDLLLQYNAVAQVLQARKKLRGMDFYIPNPKQFEAHKKTSKIIAFVAGNRAGKSEWGAFECSCAITKKYPDYFPVERRFSGPVKIRIATDRFAKIDTVIEPKLRSMLPHGEIVRIRRSPQGYLTKVFTRDGSMIEFLTMEQDDMAFEGADIDLFWGDEPVDRNKWIATQRGLVDRGGLTILSFTPLIEPWMKEEIVDKADDKNVAVIYASIRDNKFDIEGNPILKEQDIAWFESMLDEDEKATRMEGKFFHLRGAVYKEYSSVVHEVTDFEYMQGYPVIRVIDPHDRLPHWVIWAMVDKIDDLYVMYEAQISGTTKELAAQILFTEKYFGWNMAAGLIDPNFGESPSAVGSGETMIQELSKYKVAVYPADDRDFGRLQVKDYLHYIPGKPIDITNKPKIYFVKDGCPKTIKSLMNLQHAEWKGKTASEKDPKEDTKEKGAHGADCVRYLCAARFTFSQFRQAGGHEGEIPSY